MRTFHPRSSGTDGAPFARHLQPRAVGGPSGWKASQEQRFVEGRSATKGGDMQSMSMCPSKPGVKDALLSNPWEHRLSGR